MNIFFNLMSELEPGVWEHFEGKYYEVIGMGNVGKPVKGKHLFERKATHTETGEKVMIYAPNAGNPDNTLIISRTQPKEQDNLRNWNQKFAVYRALDRRGELYIRPIEDFLGEIVLYDGILKKKVPRFKKSDHVPNKILARRVRNHWFG